MDTREYIDSGILELYVYGLLDVEENSKVNELSKNHKDINDEIISIETAIVNLSASFSPFISAETYEKTKAKLDLKYGKVVEMKPRSNWSAYMGWAVALLLLLGIGYLYRELNSTQNHIVTIEGEKTKLQESVVILEIKNKQSESVLSVIRDNNNTIVTLAGQAAAPDAYAKIYWNRTTQSVYVDAAGLPPPPEGQVYQVWSLKLMPTLTPTSIGLLENFTADNQQVFPVSSTSDAEAFGITLEPAGGSASPTMEQLYTLGKV